ncbi:hypothetical protein [Brevibacillus centrosporus]|uniref:hypothetical protein n=1 Tax=Brevibacillus centrosporus TaxID=54910 RepID=UPI003B026A09
MTGNNGETISVERVNVPFFIAVYCFAGRVSTVEISSDLLFLWEEMKKNLAIGFHGALDDDARIFNQDGKEVYFYNEDEELVELFCPSCLSIKNQSKDEAEICDSCSTKMTQLLLESE